MNETSTLNLIPSPARIARFQNELTKMAGADVELITYEYGYWVAKCENELGALRVERTYRSDKVRALYSETCKAWCVTSRK